MNRADPKVLSCHILMTKPHTAAHKALAIAKMSNGQTVELLSWSPEQATFSVEDFIGKTQAEIKGMYHKLIRE